MEKEQLSMPSSDDSKVIGFGFSVIFIVFVILGGWSAYAPLATSSVAVGKVSADLDKKTIQHLEGGIVEKIYVKDGDSVKKGDILIKLEDVQIKSQLDILQSQYQDLLGAYTRLEAQDKELDNITFPSELTDQKVITNQKDIFYNTKKSQEDEKAITKNRIEQLMNQFQGLESLISSKRNRLSSLDEEISELEILFKEQLVDKVRIRELKREKNSLEGDVANASSEIAKIKEQIEETKTQQLLREKEFKKETLNLLVETKSKLSDIKSKMIATKDTLLRTKIIAPIDGVVVGLDIHTVGGVIGSGNPILEIVPEDSQLVVVAQVQTTDIDKVTTGLTADIRFSAFNMNQAHVIEGKVIHVSADSFIDEATGSPYYEAKVEVTKHGKEQLKDYDFHLVSGMPAEVMIKIGERTPLSYFVKPFTDMLTRGFNEE